MFSLSEGQRQQPLKHTAISTAEGPQQSSPTAMALACSSTFGCSGDWHPCLPRCVVEGRGGSTRVVSGRGIGGSTCSSAGDRRYCFPHCVGVGGGQGARFCRWNSGIDSSGPGDPRYFSLRCISWGRPLLYQRKYRRRNRRPAVLFPRPHQLGGLSGRASRLLERCHRTWQRRRNHRPAVLLPLLRRRRGWLESSRQQLGPLVTHG